MKIIVAGAGEVGRHVSKMLSSDDHDIILLDSEEKLAEVDPTYDLLKVVGSPTSLSDLNSCEVKDADMFIAVTPHDSQNLMACMFAKKLGAKKTISRVDNQEYTQPRSRDLFQGMGVDLLIYPEMLAADEIIDTMKYSWIRELHSFCDSALVVLCVKVRANAEIINKQFKEDYFRQNTYRVVAIKRDSKTIIPAGNNRILANDMVYFICRREEMEVVKNACGKTSFEIQNILIMGGSRIAVKTANKLSDNYEVKIIENDRKKCYELANKTSGALIIEGDGRNLAVLRDEGIEDADVFIALTANSEANVMACMAAKRFGIRKTIAEVENIDYIELAENLDIGTIINKKVLAASKIYQHTLDEDALSVQCLTYSDAEIIEFVVKEGDRITKKMVKDLKLPDDVNIGGIIREGEGYIVDGNTQIMKDDHVVIFSMGNGINELAKYFNN